MGNCKCVFPGVRTIAGLAGGFLAIVGGMVTNVVVAKRRGNALQAVIKGVEIADSPMTKESIKMVAGSLGIEPYINKLVKKYFPA